jgi:hypothetical protein
MESYALWPTPCWCNMFQGAHAARRLPSGNVSQARRVCHCSHCSCQLFTTDLPITTVTVAARQARPTFHKHTVTSCARTMRTPTLLHTNHKDATLRTKQDHP